MAVTEDETDRLSEASAIAQLNSLIGRADSMLNELELFRKRLHTLRLEATFVFTKFQDAVATERRVLHKTLSNCKPGSRQNVVRGTNLNFFECVWSTAKASRDVVAIPSSRSQEAAMSHSGGHRRKLYSTLQEPAGCGNRGGTHMEVICDGGRTWKKVSTIDNRRLLFDLAREGWDSEESGNERGDGDDNDCSDTGDGDIPLLKTAKTLARLAKHTRHRTKNIAVHLILPRIERNQTSAVDRTINTIEGYGVAVFCRDACPTPLPIEEALPVMLPGDPEFIFSSTLNIDCTVLIALISDLSHSKPCLPANCSEYMKQQSASEADDQLLPTKLYPILVDHDLSCTKEAATQMRSIVSTMGTPSEKARASILLGDDTNLSKQTIHQEMQRLSIWPVSPNLRLPIVVVDWTTSETQARLPPAISKIGETLSPINQSIFMKGWACGQTTITSNGTAVKQIWTELEKLEDIDEDLFPSLWSSPVARSLVGMLGHGKQKKVNY